MLTALRVKNYALIDEVDVEFGPGLNVLSGETGAGKSIVVGAIALLLGARASTGDIRADCEMAVIEGVFADGDTETLVRREIRRDQTSRCTIDGQLSTVRMLRERGETWAQLHGQHEGVRLLQTSYQRVLLDAFGDTDAEVERVTAAARTHQRLVGERSELSAQRAEREDRRAFLEHQIQGIDAAQIQRDEDTSLEEEARELRTAIDRAGHVANALEALEGRDAHEPLRSLVQVERALKALAELDPATGPMAQRSAAIRIELEDLLLELQRYQDGVEHDPGRLDRVENRRQVLADLKRRHGGSLDSVLVAVDEMRGELVELESIDGRLSELDARIDRLREEIETTCGALSEARESAAERLASAVRGRLADLEVGDGHFDVVLNRVVDDGGVAWRGDRYRWSDTGLEDVEFRIAPNAGEGSRPLGRVASGGELSRILLAIKSALAQADRTPTLVFDEIDAGIGGVAAHRVADELRAVARHHQVIVVTHLAQIAAAADRHLVVDKTSREGRTRSRVTRVDGAQRVVEISRLLGGDPDRDVSIEHAQELLGERT